MARPRKTAAKAEGSLLKADDTRIPEIPVEEQPYPLPEGWRWVYASDIFDIIYGKGLSTKNLLKEGYPVFGANGSIGYYSEYMYTEPRALMSCRGAYSGVMNLSLPFSYVTNNSLIVEGKYYKFSPKFIFYLFSSLDKKALISGTAQPQVTIQNFNNFSIPLPPINLHDRIVDRIESLFAKLDEAKEKAEAVLDGFESRKAAILHKAFTGELTAKWREEKGVKKESWQFLPFDKCISNMQNGISKRKGNSGRDYIVLRLTNLVNNKITLEEFNAITLDSAEIKKYSLNKNDILMIRVNGSKNNIGKQFMVEEDNKYAFCDHIIRIKYDISKIDNKYAFLFSQGNYYKYYVQNNMVSSAGQNTISRKGLANLAIPLPTIPEQKEITRLLESLLEKEQQSKEAAQTVLEQIEMMKKAILARAFRGELTRQVHN